MDAGNLAQDPTQLEPLQLDIAGELIAAWELEWWEAVRTAFATDPPSRLHGDVTDHAEAARLVTQWVGRNFEPEIAEFFAVHLTGIRVALMRLVVGEYRGALEELDELRGEVDKLRSLIAGAGAVLREAAPTCGDDEQACGL